MAEKKSIRILAVFLGIFFSILLFLPASPAFAKTDKNTEKIYSTTSSSSFLSEEYKIIKANPEILDFNEWQTISVVVFLVLGTLLISLVFYQRDLKRKAEATLEISHEKYRLITDNISDVIWVLNLDKGKFNFVSPSVFKLRGITPEESLNERLEDTLAPESFKLITETLKRLKEDLEKASDSQKTYIIEIQQTCKNGGTVWVETSIKGRYNSESQIEVIASSRNIAERKKSDEKAKDSMILLASCLENLKDIIMFAIDRDFNYLYCNRAHKKAMMAAYGTEVEIGMNIIECTKNTDDKINSKINYSHALNGEAISTIQEFGEKSRSYYETFYNPIFGENNEIIGAAVLARDITDRKNRESEILHISFHDKLTGLYNRRFLEEEIIRLDIKRQLPITIVMVDLNSLKVANDTFGHNTGDIIIREAAGLLKKICRSDDILARWGGDEFVILLPKTPIKDAEEIVTRIKKECSKFVVENIPIGFAIGIAAKTKENQDINRTINEAESNMYRNKLVEKASNSSSTILVLEQALREKSNETMEHTIRIRDYALQLGKAVKLPSNQMDEIYLLASLHDIGKVAIPEKILLKKGKLTEKEWAIVKRHPSIGFNIAQSSPQIIHIANLILACHENWDGTGYPQGLKGEEIPIVSRIMFICDSYDVMTSARKYKKPIARDDAIMELKKCSGKQFDPALVKKFIELV